MSEAMSHTNNNVLLSDAQVASYQENGFLFIPELLSPAEVSRLKAAMGEVLSEDRREVDKEDTSNQLRCAFQ